MTINKFQGKTKEEAIEKAKQEMGDAVVIMNVKEKKAGGLFSFLKRPTYEVTAALEERERPVHAAPSMVGPTAGTGKADGIDFRADEKIVVPIQEQIDRTKEVKAKETSALEEKLKNLQTLLDEKMPAQVTPQPAMQPKQQTTKQEANQIEPKTLQEKQYAEEFKFLKMIYKILLKNEVNEKYVNEILEDVEKSVRKGSSVDVMLSNIYQKLILKFGTPREIELGKNKPKIAFFVGPTGVGKTTTIAKIASKYKLEKNKKVALFTADTYRIAAAEQLRTYATILDTPFEILYAPQEMSETLAKHEDCDLILVDTAGFSYRNENQKDDLKKLLAAVEDRYDKEVFLVLSATTKYQDLLDITDAYRAISDYRLIFTKLDETTTYGSLLNIRLYSDAEISYVTNGQNVPDDISVLNTQWIVKQLLGGK